MCATQWHTWRKLGQHAGGTHGANWGSTQVADMAHVCHAVAHMAQTGAARRWQTWHTGAARRWQRQHAEAARRGCAHPEAARRRSPRRSADKGIGRGGDGGRKEMVGMKKQGAGAKAKADARGMAAKKNGARGGRSRRRKLPRRKEEWHDAATRRRAARSARART